MPEGVAGRRALVDVAAVAVVLAVVEDGQLGGRAGHGHRQPPARLRVAEQHLGHGAPAPRSRVPGTQHRRYRCADLGQCVRPALHQHHHDRRPGRRHRGQQGALRRWQGQVREVDALTARHAGRRSGPGDGRPVLLEGGAGGAGTGAAQHQHRDVRAGGKSHGLGHPRHVVPHQLAATGVSHFGAGRDGGTDAVQDGDAVTGPLRCRVVAGLLGDGIRVGPEHRDPPRGPGQRQDPALVREQRHRGAGDPLAQAADVRPAGVRRPVPGPRPLEQTEAELQREDPRHRGVQRPLGHQTLLHGLAQPGEAVVPQTQVAARVQGQGRRRHGVTRQPHQPVDRGSVRHHDTVETPLVAQQFGQQIPVGHARHAVELVVGGHHPGRARGHPGPGRREVDLVQLAVAQLRRRAVAPADRAALAGEVLQHHGDTRPPRTLDQRLGHPCREIRVLGEALLAAPPARITYEVQRGHQGDVRAPGPQFGARAGHGIRVQLRIPGGAGRQVDRQHRAVQRLVAVRHLLDQQDGDAQPGVVPDVPLDGRRRQGAVPGVQAVLEPDARPGVRPLESVQRAHAVEGGDLLAERVREAVTVRAALVGVPAVHALVELAHLLRRGHALQQVADAFRHRRRRVAVAGDGHRSSRTATPYASIRTSSTGSPSARPCSVPPVSGRTTSGPSL